jgi:hypothetical protein
MSQYRGGLNAAFITLHDVARHFRPQPELLERAGATLSVLLSAKMDSVAVNLNRSMLDHVDELLRRVSLEGTAGLDTNDRAAAGQLAKAVSAFIGEMESA